MFVVVVVVGGGGGGCGSIVTVFVCSFCSRCYCSMFVNTSSSPLFQTLLTGTIKTIRAANCGTLVSARYIYSPRTDNYDTTLHDVAVCSVTSFRPDTTVMVDRALQIRYVILSVYGAESLASAIPLTCLAT